MPITDHEKLQVHPRPSSDFLAAVPIKKRRILFSRSPSPPPESPAPTLADCAKSENESESSEHGNTSSKSEGNSSQVDIVTRQVASYESLDLLLQSQKDCGVPEEKPEYTELRSTFSETVGNLSQVNTVTGKIASSGKKPESSDPVTPYFASGCTSMQANSVLGDDVSCEPHKLQPKLAECGTFEKKPELLLSGSQSKPEGCPSSQMNTMTGELPILRSANCGISEKKPKSSELDSSFRFTGVNPADVNSLSGKHASVNSSELLMRRDLKLGPKHEILPTLSEQGSGLNLVANSLDGTRNVQDIIQNNNCARLTVTGSPAIHSERKHIFEGKFNLGAGVYVKQDKVELQNDQSISGDRKFNEDSRNLHNIRSNWDLNTTMDAWEGSSANSLANKGTINYGIQDIQGIRNRNSEPDSKQIPVNEPRRTDLNIGNNKLQKNDDHLKLPNAHTSMVNSNSEACLDLQLKPAFLSNPCNSAFSELPLLSLGMNPVQSTIGPPLNIGRAVKSEPIEKAQKDTANIQLGIMNSLDLNRVKSEPREGQDISKAANSANMNLACSRIIKAEPLENQSQAYAKTAEGNSFFLGNKSHSLSPESTTLHQNDHKDENKSSDMDYECPDMNSVSHNLNISNKSSNMVDKAPIPGCATSFSTSVTQYPVGIASDPSASVSNSINGNDMNSLPKACETSSFPLASLPGSLTPKHKEDISSESAPKLSVKMNSSNARHDEVLQEPYGNIKVEAEDKIGAELCDSTCKSDSSHVSAGVMSTVLEQLGEVDQNSKDGDVKYPAFNDSAEGSSGETQEQVIKATGEPQEQEIKATGVLLVVDNSKEAKAQIFENKVKPISSTVGALSTDKKNIRKIISKTLKDHQKNDKGLEMKLKSSEPSAKTNLPRNNFGAAGSEKQNAEGPSIAKNDVSCKSETLEKEGALRKATDRGTQRRIIYLNSALAKGKKSFTSDRSISSREERERPVDRSFRDEPNNERSRKVESERRYGHAIENHRPDFVHDRNRANRLNSALHGDRNPNAYHVSVGSRKPRNEETVETSSHLVCQRQSPMDRAQIPLNHHLIRETRRDVPDFVLLAHQENLRNFSEDMEFERAESIMTRRSFSPPLRRGGGALNLPPNCSRRSNHQWSPHELVHSRSPPRMRLNRIQSPHERSCFPEEIMARRRGGSPPLREHEFAIRPVRGPDRNLRRFAMIDPREISNEEYYVNDEFVEDRRCDERRGPPLRSFRQQHNIIEDVGPRSLRLHADTNEGFSEGNGPREFDVRFRNRLGNSSGRFRDIVEDQEDNYRSHEEQEWRDNAAFNGARTKRRRY